MTAAPRVHPRVAWQTLAGSVVIVDLERGLSLELNETGSFIWERLARGQAEGLPLALSERFSVTAEEAEAAAGRFLATMRERGLLEG